MVEFLNLSQTQHLKIQDFVRQATFSKLVRLFYSIFSDTLEQIAGEMDGNNNTNPAQQWIQTFKENKRWVTILILIQSSYCITQCQ